MSALENYLASHLGDASGDGGRGLRESQKVAADDTSIMERKEKIDEMRAKLEDRMSKLMGGNDLQILTKQVEELRATTPKNSTQSNDNKNTELDDLQWTAEDEAQAELDKAQMNSSSSGLNVSVHGNRKATTRRKKILKDISLDDKDKTKGSGGGGGGDIQWNPNFDGASVTTADDSTTTTSTSAWKDIDGNDETVYVASVELTDPYGDTGMYTGNVRMAERMPHGLGTMKYTDGRTYEGQWTKGQWDGPGVATFANGDRFEGTYSLDRRHGHGKYSWADGRSYEGDFQEDQRHGVGEYKWPDGAIYRGQFVSGHRHGQGTYLFADGSEYTGEWKAGKYHGVGMCTWKDGRVYQGEWVSGQAHGYGTERRANGTVRHEGLWEKDNPVRNGKSKRSSSSRKK